MKLLVIILFFSLAFVSGKSQDFIILADSIGKWSQQEIRNLANYAEKPSIAVRSKIVAHAGTTGTLEIELTNLSGQPLDLRFGLKSTLGELSDNIIDIDDTIVLSDFIPEKPQIFTLDLKECAPKNSRRTTTLDKIKACQPRLLFVSGWLPQ